MPRYFFDVTDSRGHHRDDVGDDFDSFDEAQELCRSLLLDMTRQELPDGEEYAITCDVRDETGRFFYRCTLTYKGTWEP